MNMNNPKSLLLLLLFFTSDSSEDQQKLHPCWLKIKALFKHAQSFIFTPNLDFRGRINNDEPGEDGPGSKVKEAVAKSLGKETATVGESAKSAAQMLKDTMSSNNQPQEL